jgi:hypothetical protein
MTWIPVHDTVWTHPRTLQLAELLNIPPILAAAHCIKLWHWTIAHEEDGDLSHITDTTLAIAAGWTGKPQALSHALREAGLISNDGKIHNWDKYVGPLLDQRQKNRERQTRFRLKQANSPTVTRDIPVTSPLANRHVTGLQERTEQNRTEQKNRGGNAHTRKDDDHPALQQIRDKLPELNGNQDATTLLLELIHTYPRINWPTEAANCRAYYKQPPTNWATTFASWINGAKRVAFVDGGAGPPSAAKTFTPAIDPKLARQEQRAKSDPETRFKTLTPFGIADEIVDGDTELETWVTKHHPELLPEIERQMARWHGRPAKPTTP